MAAVIASLAGVLILAGIVYDIARLITPDEPRRPPRARLRGGVPRWPRRNGGSWVCAFTPAFDETGPLLIAIAWLAALTTAAAVMFRRTATAPHR